MKKVNLLAQLCLAMIGWTFVLLVLPTLIFFCPIVNTPLVDKLATWPLREEYWVAGSEFSGVKCRQLMFPVKVDGDKRSLLLSGAYYNTEGAKDIFLISHGNGGSITGLHRSTQIAHMLAAKHSVFIYDYEGYGVSEGEPKYASLRRDGIAAFDYVRDVLRYQPNQIVLYGQSMGTGVSCEIARVREPKAIVLDSGYTNAEQAAKFLFPMLTIYPRELFPEPRYDNLQYLKGKHPPVLIVTPLIDGTVPPAHGYRMAAEGMPLITHVALPHSFHCGLDALDQDLYSKSLGDFIKRVDSFQLAPGSSPLIFANK